MATSAQVALSEYLTTAYHPDCDWIEGELKERNLGEGQHAILQKFFLIYLGLREAEWNIRVLPEQRVQVSEQRFRIPDVCLVAGDAPFERIVHTAPLLCIEILSSGDRLSEMDERIADYFRMGVQDVWVIDPWKRQVLKATAGSRLETAGDTLTVAGTVVQVAVSAIFVELDRLEGCS